MEDLEIVVACGLHTDTDNMACHSFDGQVWAPLPVIDGIHCPYLTATRNHYIESVGWLVIGLETCDYQNVSATIFTKDGAWITLTLESPYDDFYPGFTCSVQLNSSHIYFCGGYDGYHSIDSAWMLNLESLQWTAAPSMAIATDSHGCTKGSVDGSIIVAGGDDFYGNVLDTVHTFHPDSCLWKEEEPLPGTADPRYPIIMAWHNTTIFLEYGSTNIWIREVDESWTLSKSSLGASFSGKVDAVTLVPDWFASGICP